VAGKVAPSIFIQNDSSIVEHMLWWLIKSALMLRWFQFDGVVCKKLPLEWKRKERV